MIQGIFNSRVDEPVPSTSKLSQQSGLALEEASDAQKQFDPTSGDQSADDKTKKHTAGSRRSSAALRRENSTLSRPTPDETLSNINEDNVSLQYMLKYDWPRKLSM